MQLIRWTRFRWDLERLAKHPVPSPTPYTIRPVDREEEGIVRKVAQSSLAVDIGWSDAMKTVAPAMQKAIAETFLENPAHTLAVLHGVRIIGVSVIDAREEAENHLITGPCILHEYRNRGLGSALLRASLELLKAEGRREGRGLTRDRTIAARFVYPKFGGNASQYHAGPQPEPRLAA